MGGSAWAIAAGAAATIADSAKAAATREGDLARSRHPRSLGSKRIDTRIHPHIKPAGLIRRLIAAVTAPGDLIIDPAAGSFRHAMSHMNSVAALAAAISIKPRRPPNERTPLPASCARTSNAPRPICTNTTPPF